jgi:hypothetical protein
MSQNAMVTMLRKPISVPRSPLAINATRRPFPLTEWRSRYIGFFDFETAAGAWQITVPRVPAMALDEG